MIRLIIFFIFISFTTFAQTFHRYTDSLFVPFETETNAIYATVPELNSPYQGESFTHSTSLKFHFFEPQGDTLEYRPLLICAHGGGFVSGNKENDDMMELCRIFASRGYVTATIQYRLGMNLLSPISGARAVYRGIQDGRAAVRFFKENANTYGIDTNSIYFIGSSAGSFIGLHNLFMNEESERPPESYQISNFPPTTNDGPDLGSLDAIEPTYIHGAHPNAIISLWGALQDTLLIKSTDNGSPVLLVHGTDDDIVPFNVGSPFNLVSLPPTYGSNPISKRLSNLSFNFETYFVEGKGHEFYGVLNGNWNPAPNAYWNTVVAKTTNFLWEQHKPTAGFNFDIASGSVQFYDQSIGATQWFWNFGDGASSNEQNPIHEYQERTYTINQLVQNELQSWDTTSISLTIIIEGIGLDNEVPTKFELFQNYPNPFNPTTTIKYSIPKLETGHISTVKLKIYNVLGRKVATLVNKKQSPGNYHVIFGTDNLQSGIYLYSLHVDNFKQTKKMILLK